MVKDSETPLTLSQAHVSRIVAIGMVMLVFVFVAGYYLGKKSQTEELAAHMQQGAFADQIHSSMYTMYHAPGTDASGSEDEISKRDEINKEEPVKGQQR